MAFAATFAATPASSKLARPPSSPRRCQACRRHRNVSAKCVESQRDDVYVRAALRVDSLLASSFTEHREINQMLDEESTTSRLWLAVATGVAVTASALAICWATHSDPLGGASLTTASVEAGLLGALAGVPLIASREILWNPQAQQHFPVLREVKAIHARNLAPFLRDMSPEQMAVVLVMETIPQLLLLLPASVGIGQHAFSPPLQALANSVHIPLSYPATSALALTVAAILAGEVKAMDWDVSQQEQDVLAAAVTNADMFYRLTSSGNQAGAREAAAYEAEVFQSVACTWLASRRLSAKTIKVLTTIDFLYLSALWLITGDMTAPVVMSLAMHTVDFARSSTHDLSEDFV